MYVLCFCNQVYFCVLLCIFQRDWGRQKCILDNIKCIINTSAHGEMIYYTDASNSNPKHCPKGKSIDLHIYPDRDLQSLSQNNSNVQLKCIVLILLNLANPVLHPVHCNKPIGKILICQIKENALVTARVSVREQVCNSSSLFFSGCMSGILLGIMD